MAEYNLITYCVFYGVLLSMISYSSPRFLRVLATYDDSPVGDCPVFFQEPAVLPSQNPLLYVEENETPGFSTASASLRRCIASLEASLWLNARYLAL